MVSRKGIWGIGAFLVVLVLVLLAAGSYNGLVKARNAVESQAKQVDVAYQTQFRLIPQVASFTQQYLANETDVMRDLAALRSGASQAANGTLQMKEDAAAQYARFIALVGNRLENYPTLQSGPLYKDLITYTVEGEKKIGAEKVRYNDLVRDYNTKVQSFPTNLIAGMGGFHEAEFIGFADRPNLSSFGDNQL